MVLSDRDDFVLVGVVYVEVGKDGREGSVFEK